MSAVLHISDLHFGVDVQQAELALRKFHEALAPCLVVVSGDLTQRARPREFARGQAFFSDLGARALLAVPGNHDIPLFQPWLRFTAPYERYRASISASLEPEFESADLLVLGVNSTSPYRLENGYVDAQARERVEERLSRARPEQLRLVVTHQPFLPSRPQDHRRVIRDAGVVLERWTRAGADLLLAGHNHVPGVDAVPGGRPAYVVQAGTTLSNRYRDRKPNSLNVIHALPGPGPRRCRVERYDLRGTSFEMSAETTLDLAER